jgi:adenine-specific DNA-methyltransferase
MPPVATTTPAPEFREASVVFNRQLTKEERSNQGIYFTPRKARDLLFTKLRDLGVHRPSRILEPSFGSGEFLYDARTIYPDAELYGVEKNETLFQSVVDAVPNTHITCADFLEWGVQSPPILPQKVDLIIGNPPYFIMKIESTEKKKYANAFTGRPNIYVIFLYKCLETHLEVGGFLAFIIPTSIYNSSYYQPMRDYIYKNTHIRYVETLNKPGFYETGQETTLLILQKKEVATPSSNEYIFRSGFGLYISPFYTELQNIIRDTTTISALGLGVKTGNVVWNQVKDNLADEGTLLVYSSNINKCELKLDNLGGTVRKQYVSNLDKPTLTGPVILVERGYGNSFSFNSVLVEMTAGFYAENHINVIYPKTQEAIPNLHKVIASFRDERSKQFIKWFVGNGSLSATELETLLPIFHNL